MEMELSRGRLRLLRMEPLRLRRCRCRVSAHNDRHNGSNCSDENDNIFKANNENLNNRICSSSIVISFI